MHNNEYVVWLEQFKEHFKTNFPDLSKLIQANPNVTVDFRDDGKILLTEFDDNDQVVSVEMIKVYEPFLN